VATPVWSSKCRARLAAGAPITAAEGNVSTGYRVSKRLLDIVGSLLLLLFLAPLMLVVFLVLFATTRGRPIFVQRRIGYRGHRFPMLKFRSMQLNAAAVKQHVANEQQGPIFKNRRDPRITRLGAVLRKTSIDETPQLVNVLAGHMSLVGPRPPVEQEVVEYRLWQRRRLAVKPGLTCLWQVSGRSEIEFEDWVRMDLWYIRNQGFWTDLKLLLKTPWSVLSCAGAY
jgi:lipopolysaccharide/colanic/teichoic acid biosynthesis glycosyltransferase